MRPFTVAYPGDFRDVDGRPIGDLATDPLDRRPWLRYRFLGDLGPAPRRRRLHGPALPPGDHGRRRPVPQRDHHPPGLRREAPALSRERCAGDQLKPIRVDLDRLLTAVLPSTTLLPGSLSWR